MKYNSSSLFPLLMLLMLTGLTLWLQRASQPDTVAAQIARHDPDYMVENFTIKRFNTEGRLYQTLAAREMRHYPDDDSTEMEMPRMAFLQDRPTHITADKAWVDSGGNTVVLKQNVVVTHEAPNALPTLITTSVLTAKPNEETAHTDEPVTITRGETVFHGQGMDVNNKTQISVLHGRVHGTIAPHRQ